MNLMKVVVLIKCVTATMNCQIERAELESASQKDNLNGSLWLF